MKVTVNPDHKPQDKGPHNAVCITTYEQWMDVFGTPDDVKPITIDATTGMPPLTRKWIKSLVRR